MMRDISALISGQERMPSRQRDWAVSRASRGRLRPTLVGVQVDVSAADGQAVGLTDSWDADHIRSKSRSRAIRSDDDELLGVLLPEVGPVRLDDMEQLGHDGRHADEMSGPRGPFVEVGDGAGVDLGLGTRPVHLLRSGSEDQTDTGGFEHAEVAVEVTGVGGEVLAGAELGRIDEDGGGYYVILGSGAFDEGHVSPVEVAHGRDQAEGAGGRGSGCSEGGDGPG